MNPNQNEILLFGEAAFGENGKVRRILVTDYTEKQVHSLHALTFGDILSSVKWKLDAGNVVTLHEHVDGSGRRFEMAGTGDDTDLANNNFDNCASSFSWRRS